MFVSLFIGNPPENVDSQDNFSLVEIGNKKTALELGINKRHIPIQNISPFYANDGFEFKISDDTTESMIKDRVSDINVGTLCGSTISGYRMKITHDTITLHPRFTFAPHGDKETPDYIDISQIFVNIDTDVFVPLIYQLPEGVTVKDTYHYGKHHYGFILELMGDIRSTDIAGVIEIYGYDKRLPDNSKMSRYRMIKVSVNGRFATQEEVNRMYPLGYPYKSSGLKLKLHTVSVQCSGITKDKKSQFFKSAGMYEKNNRPRLLRLTGPLFTTNIIGTAAPKEANELIENAKIKNNVPVGYEHNYYCISKEEYETEADWYQAIVQKLISLGENKVRAVALLGDDIKVDSKDVRKAKLQHVISIKEDGTAVSLISNR